MSDYRPVPPEKSGRRSKQVALVLLGTMGVVGGVVAWDAWQRAGANPAASADNTAVEQGGPPAAPVAADRTYSNNDYVPGAGYYHAPYHAWYPHPYNYYDPNRGYFAGGLWGTIPFLLAINQSQPNFSAVSEARLAQQRYEQQQRARNNSSSFFGGGSYRSRSSGGSSFFSRSPSSPPSTRPTATPSSSPSPSKSSPSIQRGGFGSSGHDSSSGHGASGSGS